MAPIPDYSNEYQYPTSTCHVNDVDIAYQDLGNPEHEPVLLIMGGHAQMLAWPDVMIHGLIQKGHRVIRFDNRDIGFSTIYPELGKEDILAYSLEDMAQDIVGLMHHLKIESAHILGYSLGGMIGQILAAKHDSLCTSLTLISTAMTAAKHTSEFAASLKQVEAMPSKSLADKKAKGIKSYDLMRGDDPLDSDFEDLIERVLLRSDHLGQHSDVMNAAADRHDLCAEIKVPTCIIYGDKDPVFSLKTQQDMKQTIVNSELHFIKGMGHILTKKRVGEIIKYCTDMFKEKNEPSHKFPRL